MGAGYMVFDMRENIFKLPNQIAPAGQRCRDHAVCSCVQNVATPKKTGRCLADDSFPDRAGYRPRDPAAYQQALAGNYTRRRG